MYLTPAELSHLLLDNNLTYVSKTQKTLVETNVSGRVMIKNLVMILINLHYKRITK